MADFVQFLGTAGGRFVVACQQRSSAGTWLGLGGQRIILDPGPGTLLRCWQVQPPRDPRQLDAVICSHRHIDHCSDANVMVEAMTNGGYDRRGLLFAPQQTLSGDSPLCRYVQDFPEKVVALTDGPQFEVGSVRFTAVRHQHTAETYGLIFECQGVRLGFVTDTSYFAQLPGRYRGCHLLVVNVVLDERNHPATAWHLSLSHAEQIIREAQPGQAILTHFGTQVIERNPERVAAEMSERLGLPVTAATDGMKLGTGVL